MSDDPAEYSSTRRATPWLVPPNERRADNPIWRMQKAVQRAVFWERALVVVKLDVAIRAGRITWYVRQMPVRSEDADECHWRWAERWYPEGTTTTIVDGGTAPLDLAELRDRLQAATKEHAKAAGAWAWLELYPDVLSLPPDACAPRDSAPTREELAKRRSEYTALEKGEARAEYLAAWRAEIEGVTRGWARVQPWRFEPGSTFAMFCSKEGEVTHRSGSFKTLTTLTTLTWRMHYAADVYERPFVVGEYVRTFRAPIGVGVVERVVDDRHVQLSPDCTMKIDFLRRECRNMPPHRRW